MTWFNVLYYVVMILGFVLCLGLAARASKAGHPGRAGLWLIASPFVALAAPSGILFALIAVVAWMLYVLLHDGVAFPHHVRRPVTGS